jgi:hypothetical protein
VPNIAQTELEQLVRHDTSCIAEAEKRVISEDRIQAHRSRMQDAFMAEVAETRMAVDDFYPFSDEDVS